MITEHASVDCNQFTTLAVDLKKNLSDHHQIMEEDENQLDMFKENKPKRPSLSKPKPEPPRITSLSNLGDVAFKVRPFTVVRVNPTTICILHE